MMQSTFLVLDLMLCRHGPSEIPYTVHTGAKSL
jgi:hypothetical protein